MIPGVLGGIGSFAGAFELPTGYKQPVIFLGNRWSWTKLKTCKLMQRNWYSWNWLSYYVFKWFIM